MKQYLPDTVLVTGWVESLRDMRVLREVESVDPLSPTRVFVVPRDVDYSSERTDKRPSERYVATTDVQGPEHPGMTPFLEFHEGRHPRDGLNGWIIADLLAVIADRLEQHQSGPFACEENAAALGFIQKAREAIQARRDRRERSGTSGTQLVGEGEGAALVAFKKPGGPGTRETLRNMLAHAERDELSWVCAIGLTNSGDIASAYSDDCPHVFAAIGALERAKLMLCGLIEG